MKKPIISLFVFLFPILVFSQNLESINPSEANNGQTLAVSITGSNTHFIQGTGTFISFGFAHMLNSIEIVNDYSINANITVSANTITGDYNVYVYNNIDGLLTLYDGFHIYGQDPPSLVSISPSEANIGQTLDVTITGVDSHFTQASGSTNVSFGFDQGSGTVIVNSIDILSNTSILANISIPIYNDAGDYDVYVYNYYDGLLSLPNGFHINPVSVELVKVKPGIIIYPNPAKDFIYIENKSTGSSYDKIISISDLQGQILFSKFLLKNETEINIESLKTGIYIIKIESVNGVEIKGIIKM